VNEVINLIDLSKMKLYSKDGVQLTDNDIYFLHRNDFVYLDLIGNDFNFAQVLDQYTKVAQLGLTGRVFKLKKLDSSQLSVKKMIPFEHKDEGGSIVDDFLTSLNVIKSLEHRNVVR
jgi:hypothetical protein